MCKVSIIVPVYNSALTLNSCVDSILAQTFIDFELILVDDGSADKSYEICKNYETLDNRVKAIHQINAGPLIARISGIKVASGSFLFFVDSDDTIMPDALESMISYVEDNIDIVVFEQNESCLCNLTEYARRLLSFRCLTLWGKLYRRSLFNEYVYDVDSHFKVGEDFLMNLRVLSNLKGNVLLVPEKKYCYTFDSITSIQKNHKYDYAYEKSMVLEVSKIISNLPSANVLNHYLLKWQLNYIAGMMARRYPVEYNANWLRDIIENSKKYPLTIKEKLTVVAVDLPIMRVFLIVEKEARMLARSILSFLGIRR